MEVKGKYFYGNEVSEYGQENGYVDYRTFAKSFQHVLNNNLLSNTDSEYWDIENGSIWDEDDECIEVFQWYIVDDAGADIIKEWTDEILLYNENLDIYLWGVTHYGTSWDYVLTDIECLKSDDKLVYDETGDE